MTNIWGGRRISYTLPATGSYIIRVNNLSTGGNEYYPNNSGLDYYISIAKDSPACVYGININGPGLAIPTNNATSGSLTIFTNKPGCSWTVSSSVPWLTFSASSGTGTTTINFSVTANNTGSPRRGDLTVAGLTYPVYQYLPNPCSSTSISYGQTITGDFSPSDCIGNQFSIGTYADEYIFNGTAGDQIFISTSAGSLSPGIVRMLITRPNGSVRLATSRFPAQNFFTLPQTGTYQILAFSRNPLDLPNSTGTYTISLNQNCQYNLSQSAAFAPAAGLSNQQFGITTQNECLWTATSSADWLKTTSNGSGNGTISYTVEPNNTSSVRTGVITVGGKTFTVTQEANACETTPIAFGQTLNGALDNSSCASGNGFADLYTFSAGANDEIAIMARGSFSPVVELINAQGSVIQTVNGNGSSSVRLPGGQQFYPLPSAGVYTVRVSSSFQGTGAYSLSLFKAPSTPCTYSLSSPRTEVPSGGGTFFIDVTTQADCPPAAAPTSAVGQIYSIISFGGGRLTFSVSPNPTTEDRQATITVAGKTHTIFQYANIPPANDSFANPSMISGIDSPEGAPITGYNNNATAEPPSEPAHSGNAATKSVWYKWTAPEGGLYSFSTSGSSFDTVMAVYECPLSVNCSLSSITAVGSNDDTTNFDKTSKANFRASIGKIYYIAVDGKNGETGTIEFSWRQYERLYRLYLLTFNGDPSPQIPDSVTAGNGVKTVDALKITQGVYEFNLPADNNVYTVHIEGPAGIVWKPNDFQLDTSFSFLNELMEGGGVGGQNTVSYAQNAVPRFFVGFIKNITNSDLQQSNTPLTIKVGYSRGDNPLPPDDCQINSTATVKNGVPYARYECKVEPNTLHDFVPNKAGKRFKLSVLSAVVPLTGDGSEVPPDVVIEAEDAETYNVSGRVLAGGADTTVDLSYIPTGNTQRISLTTKTVDASGYYEFKNLEPNKYQLEAKRSGFVFNKPAEMNLTATVNNADISVQSACIYEPEGLNMIAAAAGDGQFTVRTGSTCEWSARSGVSWFTIRSGATVGTGLLHFTVSANTGAARQGVIKVGDRDIIVKQAASPVFALRRAPADFDGDGKTDLSIFRPAVGEWWYLRSSDGGNRTFQFGNRTDKLVPADYTGDGRTDIAFFRPSTSEWFILRSEDNSFYSFKFGIVGDIPVPADFDGDGKADAAVFRPSETTWYIQNSTGSETIQPFGISGDVPVTADYDGDGKSDIAIYRPSLGQWWLLRSSAGIIVYQFGASADKPVQGDYTGDGKTDVAYFSPSTNEWFVLRSENNSFYSFKFGAVGDVLSPGDYDGDGKADAAVFRPSDNTWFAQRSTTSETLIQGFGIAGDISVPNSFVP